MKKIFLPMALIFTLLGTAVFVIGAAITENASLSFFMKV